MKIFLGIIFVAVVLYMYGLWLRKSKKNQKNKKQSMSKTTPQIKDYITKKSKNGLFYIKELPTAEISRKKMFQQTNINQGYNKKEALHLDKSNDPLQQAISKNDVLKYSQNINNNQSAFTPQHILQGNQTADTKKILDKANTTHIPIEKTNMPKPDEHNMQNIPQATQASLSIRQNNNRMKI